MGFKDTVKLLACAYGPAGREDKIASVLADELRPYVDELRRDVLGNLIGYKKGTSGRTVMLSAHMDQIGLIALDIDENGFIRVAPVGGVSPAVTVCREVVFENGTRGVVYYENKKHTVGDIKTEDMFIDIGCRTREEAAAHVAVGDICVYAPHFVDMGDRIACGALDDRVCCAIILEALKTLSTPHDLYVVFTVQEEVGTRGAQTAAYGVKPDFSLNLDVTMSADTPECPVLPMKLGMGPTIKYMDRSAVYTKPVIDFMRAVAEKRGIAVQSEILRAGGTDGGAIQRSLGGVAAGCVSVPTRYIHTPVETVDIPDCLEAARFVCALLEENELPIE